ncbi:MAG: hypothetical protein RL674_1399, partial [Pseudomonadota bacterium]
MNKFAYGIFTLTLSQLVFAQDEPQDLGIMNIVGTSPIGGNIDADKLPTNVQTVSADQLEKAQTISLADYINRYLG